MDVLQWSGNISIKQNILEDGIYLCFSKRLSANEVVVSSGGT